jgi:hypothetical protein
MYIKTGSVATWVDGLKSQGPDMGVEVLDESGGSETDTEFVGIRSVKPTVPFVTSDLSLLSAIGMQGLFIQPASGKPGVELYGREQPQGGLPTAEATANHLKGEISDGLIVPLSIRGSNQQAAELSMLIHAILGTTPTYSNTEPIKWTSSSAIRTGAGGVANIYLPSVVKINSRYIEGNLDIQVDFGLNVFKEAVDSEVEDSEVRLCLLRAIWIWRRKSARAFRSPVGLACTSASRRRMVCVSPRRLLRTSLLRVRLD